MSRAQLRNEVIDARTSRGLSQVAAAATWGIDIGVLRAIEQLDPPSRRRFGVTTLSPLDDVLGKSAWKLFKQPDSPVARQSDVDELKGRVELLSAELADLQAQRDPRVTAVEVLVQQMTAGDFALALSILALLNGRGGSDGAPTPP